MRQFNSIVLALLLTLSSGARADWFYQESIDDTVIYRFTRDRDNADLTWFEQSLDGNSQFGVSTDFLIYYHSVEGIDPPILPNGTIAQLRLKLFFRGSSNQYIMVTVDSLDLEQINRRHFLIGPSPDDYVSLENWPLDDGKVHILLENLDQEFVLYRSIFDMIYTPAFPSDVDEGDLMVPVKFGLGNNYPNPFNPSTTIEYSLLEQAHVRIEIYNALGQHVRSLVGGVRSVGEHSVVWDGLTTTGQPAPGGVYFYRLKAGDFLDSKKMLLIK